MSDIPLQSMIKSTSKILKLDWTVPGFSFIQSSGNPELRILPDHVYVVTVCCIYL